MKLPEKSGGLGMVDIRHFWSSLKFSWIRRLLKSKAFWPTILELNLQELTGKNISVVEFLQLGPNLLTVAGKKMKNKFWKEVFITIGLIMQGAIFCYPKNILVAPFWDNPEIMRINKIF